MTPHKQEQGKQIKSNVKMNHLLSTIEKAGRLLRAARVRL
jgi:hypothetical protein